MVQPGPHMGSGELPGTEEPAAELHTMMGA